MTYEYPLSWPLGFPRTKYPAQSRFDTPEERVKRNLEFQLEPMDAANVVVTTNSELRRDGRPYANQCITDTGVAVYFTRKGREQARPLRQMRLHPRRPSGGCQDHRGRFAVSAGPT